MTAALWISKTGLAAQDKQLTTISNNLSNASTVGFKRDRAMFEDLLYQIQRQPGAQSSENTQLPSGLQLGTGVRVVATQKQFTPGNLQVTDQSLDIAINGRGFFEVELPDGNPGYTRDGQLSINSEGQLVNSSGLPIVPTLNIPADSVSITVGKDGVVTVMSQGNPTPTTVGNLTTVDFINPAGLQSMGGNIFVETASSGNPQQGTPGNEGLGSLEQGMLETSNVDVVEEMVNMITTQRVYEMNSKVISTADQMLGYLNQNV